jgi:quercetin dioxygenase-like cupin family protein
MRIPFFNVFLSAVALQAATAAVAAPQAESASSAPAQQEIVLAGSQAWISGPAETFTGRARIDPLWPANKSINASGAMVTFEPGARPGTPTPTDSAWW